MLRPTLQLPLTMLSQPNETTCGPTCLHSVYRYWGSDVSLDTVIGRAQSLRHGGTFAVFLACDALLHGYSATIYTFNINLFDPTWFRHGVDIAERLRSQCLYKRDRRLRYITNGYLKFLDLGGKLRFTDLSPPLVRGLLRRGHPIISGMSSTFLYRAEREYGFNDIRDDLRGTPSGHFVVVSGYDRPAHKLRVADPYSPHPYGSTRDYWIRMDRVFNAVMLGILTHDANLLVIAPRKTTPAQEYP